MTGEYAAAGVTPGRSVLARVDGRSGSGYGALAPTHSIGYAPRSRSKTRQHRSVLEQANLQPYPSSAPEPGLLRLGSAITPDSPRRACMTCANAARSCATCWSSSPRCMTRQFTSRRYGTSKAFKTASVNTQDCQVQQHEIRMFATQMDDRTAGIPATALLAMGELAGQIARGERRARREFTGRFADFASAASQQQFRALTSDAAR